jgi:hypothetical protein
MEGRAIITSAQYQLHCDGSAASTPSIDGDAGRIAAEIMNVIANPLEPDTLVQKTSIGGTVCLDVLASEESQGAQAVLDLNKNHGPIGLVDQTVANRRCCGTRHIAYIVGDVSLLSSTR